MLLEPTLTSEHFRILLIHVLWVSNSHKVSAKRIYGMDPVLERADSHFACQVGRIVGFLSGHSIRIPDPPARPGSGFWVFWVQRVNSENCSVNSFTIHFAQASSQDRVESQSEGASAGQEKTEREAPERYAVLLPCAWANKSRKTQRNSTLWSDAALLTCGRCCCVPFFAFHCVAVENRRAPTTRRTTADKTDHDGVDASARARAVRKGQQGVPPVPQASDA